MRLFLTATLAVSLFATSLSAAETGTLPSGKSAGVQKAQAEDNGVWWVAGVAAAIAVIGVVATSGSSPTGTVITPPTTS